MTDSPSNAHVRAPCSPAPGQAAVDDLARDSCVAAAPISYPEACQAGREHRGMSQVSVTSGFFERQVSAHPGRGGGSLRPQVRMSSRPRRRRPSQSQTSIYPLRPGLSANTTGTQAEKAQIRRFVREVASHRFGFWSTMRSGFRMRRRVSAPQWERPRHRTLTPPSQ